jgi:hypothetical protein
MKEYIGVPLHWAELRSLAVFHRKWDVVVKLDSLDKTKYDLFISDGCTMWPDEWRHGRIDLSRPCFWHDVRYFLGGTEQEREEADWELFKDIIPIAGLFMAYTMFIGVRTGGWVRGTGFNWGYGKISMTF